ncbi:MAG: sulfite exporter TauE/SafE family protein [Clostridia bacterium]|nr:sulfite exporter TauE/SafE family protein [Clostridia bacterium]
MGALLAGLLSGIIGGMGLGGGAVLIIYLTVFLETEQLRAQGINLIFFIPIALTAVIIYAVKKQIKWKTVIPIAIGGMIGAFAGIYLANIIGSEWLAKLFGGFIAALGIKEIFFTKKPCNKEE